MYVYCVAVWRDLKYEPEGGPPTFALRNQSASTFALRNYSAIESPAAHLGLLKGPHALLPHE